MTMSPELFKVQIYAPPELVDRVDAIVTRLDKEARATNPLAGKVSRNNVLLAAVRQYVEREEAKGL